MRKVRMREGATRGTSLAVRAARVGAVAVFTWTSAACASASWLRWPWGGEPEAAPVGPVGEAVPGPIPRPWLADSVGLLLREPPFDQMHWGVEARDLRTGEVLVSWDGARKFAPASNQKLLTAATALSLLGPEHRFVTLIGTTVPISSQGVVDGDLVVVASGDPTLSERWYPEAEAALDTMAHRVATAGIRRVTGRLVLDTARWSVAGPSDTWMVGDQGRYYAAPPAPFALAEGRLSVELRGGLAPGTRVGMRAWPLSDTSLLATRVVTADGDGRARVRLTPDPVGRRLGLDGTLPMNEVDTLTLAHPDPVADATRGLLAALGRAGVIVDGEPVVLSARENGFGALTPVGTLDSPPVAEIIEPMLRESVNWIAEQLFFAAGQAEFEPPSWGDARREMAAFLVDSVGIEESDLEIRDGSGLSAYNLVTPRALVALLRWMATRPDSAVYRAALAEPGEEEGTLENRLEGLEGRLFAKTGTITHVNSLSGYLVTDEGRTLAFSILSNSSGLPSGRVRESIDRMVYWLARATFADPEEDPVAQQGVPTRAPGR